MTAIEFFHYPRDDDASLAWGVRVDGVDLRAHTARATRELWRPELEDQFEDQERESAELIWRQHDGLGVLDFAEPPFLTTEGRIPLLGCLCGIWQCWPLTAHVETTPVTVAWSAFRQPGREQWGATCRSARSSSSGRPTRGPSGRRRPSGRILSAPRPPGSAVRPRDDLRPPGGPLPGRGALSVLCGRHV
ncbi:hypothetical protein [Streptomyces scabiei]|uniref:hypothetical protein n=1 Tax=Streptomyces scabiei TaxID=1930 RepID=UPI0029A2A8E3|nr:hypothetical protein [Streptomyces scabiei]MDX3112362.1 hypothetical protein [Streptomyces scabiei]